MLDCDKSARLHTMSPETLVDITKVCNQCLKLCLTWTSHVIIPYDMVSQNEVHFLRNPHTRQPSAWALIQYKDVVLPV